MMMKKSKKRTNLAKPFEQEKKKDEISAQVFSIFFCHIFLLFLNILWNVHVNMLQSYRCRHRRMRERAHSLLYK